MSRPAPAPIFIVFEGLDGAGKTSCARALAERIGAVYMTTPALPVREKCQDVIASLGECQEAAQLFYLSTVFSASNEIRRALDAGTSVVLDRYFLSTQVYAEFRGSALDLDSLQAKLLPADLTVYLDVPLAIRTQRLQQRGCTGADCETLSADADERLRALYRQKSSLPVTGHWIDCAGTGLTEQLVGDLARSIESYRSQRVPPARNGMDAQP